MVLYICYVHRALDGRYFKWLPGAPVKCWMRLILYKLPQLAVPAKILFLLMVVITPFASTTIISVKLYNANSRGFLRIHSNGEVSARQNNTPQLLKMSSVNFDLNLLIYAPDVKQYLCFNRSGLVGQKITLKEALSKPKCQFYENMTGGYNTYKTITNPIKFIAFYPSGKVVRHPKLTPKGIHRERKKQFLKFDEGFSIVEHNKKVGNNKLIRHPGMHHKHRRN